MALPIARCLPGVEPDRPTSSRVGHAQTPINNAWRLSTHVVSCRYLTQNDTAYGEMLAWKTSGPSDQFKALMDLQAVHPTCRLCQHVASRKRAQEEEAKRKSETFPPCHCQVGSNLYGVFFFSPLCLHAWQSGVVSERTKGNARRRRFCQRSEPWGDQS